MLVSLHYVIVPTWQRLCITGRRGTVSITRTVNWFVGLLLCLVKPFVGLFALVMFLPKMIYGGLDIGGYDLVGESVLKE